MPLLPGRGGGGEVGVEDSLSSPPWAWLSFSMGPSSLGAGAASAVGDLSASTTFSSTPKI